MNKVILLLLCCAVSSSITACASSQDVPIDELLSNPDRYNDRRVCTKGIHAEAFELNAMAASVRDHEGATYLSGAIIWLEGADLISSSRCFDSATSPPVRFCEARACGVFQTGGSYGHLGGYAHQLRADDR
jgi:hypothetical protein